VIVLVITALAITVIFTLAVCIEGWVGRVIHAYDRRTDALRDGTLARINSERQLFYEDQRRRPALSTKGGGDDAARSEAERDDPTEGLSGRVTAIARKAGSGALLDGGEIELIEEAARRLAEADARMQRGVEALRPFAEAAQLLDDDTPPDHRADSDMSVEAALFEHQQPTVGDLRHAAEVYASLSQAPSDE
jgi:hypothetical protein